MTKKVKLKDLEKAIKAAIASGKNVTIKVKDERGGEYHYLRSCMRKVKYGHQSTALKACQDMAQRGVTGLEAYECKFCGKWHIGHADEISAFLRKLTEQSQ